MIIYLLIILIILLLLICKKDKLMFLIALTFMYILMAFNTYNGDIDAYRYIFGFLSKFKNIWNLNIEPGFGLLFWVFNQLGLQYADALKVITFVGLLLISIIFIKYSKYPCVALALYFIAPFFPSDINQIRNFIAEGIVVFAICKWFDSNLKDIKQYILLIVVASLFHVTSLYYLLYCILYFTRKKANLYITIVVSSLAVVVLPALLSRIPFIPTFKVNTYLSGINLSFGWRTWVMVALIITGLFLVSMMLFSLKKICPDQTVIQKIEWIQDFHILNLVICLVIVIWNFNFYRMARNMLLLDYIVLTEYMFYDKKRKTSRFLLFIFIFYGSAWSAIQMFSQWNIVLQNNAILGILW